MSPLWSGLCAAWIVLRLLGVRHAIPWQVVELDGGDRRDDPPSDGGEGRDGSDGVARWWSVSRSRGHTSSRHPGSGQADISRPGTVDAAGRRRRRAIEADLPVAVDLLHVAVTAGHSLHTAVSAVGRAGSGPVSAALGEADRRFRHGSRLVDELAQLADPLGPDVRPLSTTLVVAASSGAPLGPTLQRLADAERRRLRRRTEERVRRLPVLLLAPLVGLVLPAFVLLTIVPVAITTARSGLLPAPAASSALPSASTPWSPP